MNEQLIQSMKGIQEEYTKRNIDGRDSDENIALYISGTEHGMKAMIQFVEEYSLLEHKYKP